MISKTVITPEKQITYNNLVIPLINEIQDDINELDENIESEKAAIEKLEKALKKAYEVGEIIDEL